MENKTLKQEILYCNPLQYYCNHSSNGNNVSLLMESRSINLAYGRQSIVIPNAAVRIEGKNESFSLEAMSETGEVILNYFTREDFRYAEDVRLIDGRIEGKVRRADTRNVDEHTRIRQPNA
ncbi:unnamed protein product, partial [marine sediment metagenome]